jgi:hypothetical protein
MEAFLEINYELVFPKKGRSHIFISYLKKNQKFKRKLTFDISKFKFQNGLEKKTSKFLALLRQTGLKEPSSKKCVQIILQILNPLSDTEILTPELVGDQIEMVAL